MTNEPSNTPPENRRFEATLLGIGIVFLAVLFFRGHKPNFHEWIEDAAKTMIFGALVSLILRKWVTDLITTRNDKMIQEAEDTLRSVKLTLTTEEERTHKQMVERIVVTVDNIEAKVNGIRDEVDKLRSGGR